MTTFIEFAVLGLGIAACYALLAQGVILIHRGSGVVNFAHTAMAMMGAIVFYELRSHDWALVPAFVVGVIAVTVMGVAVYWLVMRQLRRASTLTAAIASLGLLIMLAGFGTLIIGDLGATVPAFLPQDVISIGSVTVPVDRLVLLGIAVVMSAALWAASRYTGIGLALRANAESPRAASALGWSPNMLGSLTWGLGACLAGVAGILIAPLTGISATDFPLLIIPVLAAALIGGFTSFPLTLLGSLAIGIGQSEFAQYVPTTGATEALPFALIFALMAIRGRGLPARGEIASGLPDLGTGRVRLMLLVPATVGFAVLLLTVFSVALVSAITFSLCWALIILSVVVLTGYAGQLSLVQMALAGVAALVAGDLVANQHFPFVAALVIAVAFTVAGGLIVALPAFRARGVNLAVVTLGVAVTVNAMVFNSQTFIGPTGLSVESFSIFGINLSTFPDPTKYAVFVLVVFALCVYGVGWVRRTRLGRRFIAVRTNERAAAALGINVLGTKMWAFGLAGALASLGGILLAFRTSVLDLSSFTPIQSVDVSAFSVVGGVGYLSGAPVGSTLPDGGFGSWVFATVFPGLDPIWLGIIGGGVVILLLIMAPDGLAKPHIELAKRALRPRRRAAVAAHRYAAVPDAGAQRITPAQLEVSNLVVRYGGVTAVDGATLSVGAGEVVALIGPNGAGKTSLIDAVTGFTRMSSGMISLDGRAVSAWSAHRRARAGISRSFQSLELFESSTVRENLQVASDPSCWQQQTKNLHPRFARAALSSSAAAVVDVLELSDCLDERVSSLPYGRRRLVAIARAVATGPSILLLDEPASGLSDVETRELADVVRRLAREWGIGVLVVEHHMTFVMTVADRIVALDFGRQIASGTPAEIRADEAVVRAYLGSETANAPDRPIAGGATGAGTSRVGA